MGDEWGFYPCQVDGEPASIYLNMGIGRVAPLADFGTAARLRLRMNNPRPDGLSSHEEYDKLTAIEDALKEEIERNSATIYVGRNTSGGCRDFFFYTGDENAFHAAASAVIARFNNYRTETELWPDGEWRFYFDFLYPDDDQKQVIGN